MNRITWTEPADRYSGPVGHITIADGRVKIASISYSVKRNDPKPWVLRTEIPGWTNARHHETREAAQESAERILTAFVTSQRRPAPTVSEVFATAASAHEAILPDSDYDTFRAGFSAAVNWMNGGRG